MHTYSEREPQATDHGFSGAGPGFSMPAPPPPSVFGPPPYPQPPMSMKQAGPVGPPQARVLTVYRWHYIEVIVLH